MPEELTACMQIKCFQAPNKHVVISLSEENQYLFGLGKQSTYLSC